MRHCVTMTAHRRQRTPPLICRIGLDKMELPLKDPRGAASGWQSVWPGALDCTHCQAAAAPQLETFALQCSKSSAGRLLCRPGPCHRHPLRALPPSTRLAPPSAASRSAGPPAALPMMHSHGGPFLQDRATKEQRRAGC